MLHSECIQHSIGGKVFKRPDSYPSHDADGFSREEARVTHFIVHNAVKNFLLIVTRKWRLKESQTIPITLHCITYKTHIHLSVYPWWQEAKQCISDFFLPSNTLFHLLELRASSRYQSSMSCLT